MRALSAMPGLVAAPMLRGQLILRRSGRDYAVAALGVDPVRQGRVTSLAKDMVSGSLDTLASQQSGIVLGRSLAEKMGVAVGDTVIAATTAGGQTSLRVVGLFATGLEQQDLGLVYVNLAKQQSMQARPRVVNEIGIRLRDISRSVAVAQQIENRFGFKTAPWEETYGRFLEVVRLQNWIIYSTTGSILLVAGFGIFNIISTVVLEKSRDIAIMRAIGIAGAAGGGGVRGRGRGGGRAGRAAGLPARLGPVDGPRAGAGTGCDRSGHETADRAELPDLRLGERAGLRRRTRRGLAAGAAGGADGPAGDRAGRHVTAVLEARGLTRILPGLVPVTLVSGIDLAFTAGSFTAITGPSGSGKSSLLYLLGLLDPPTRGEVLVDGVPTARLDGEARARLRLAQFGFVFQFHFLLPELTVLDNVTLPMRELGRLHGAEMRARALELLAALDMTANAQRLPGELSGGERQRTAIARALANDPRFVLADEPTGALDTRNGRAVFAILQGLAAQGRTVIVVTHDEALAAFAGRRVHLVDGRVVRDGVQAPAPG